MACQSPGYEKTTRRQPLPKSRKPGSITDSDITNDNTDEVSRALNRSPSQRLALRPEEIAEALGVGRSFVYEHVLPELRVVRRGRVRLVPVSELADWLERSAARL